jgi:hypothetical protein
MENKKLVIVAVVCLFAGYMLHSSTQPKHPVRRWLLKTAVQAGLMVPFMLDEEPQPEMRTMMATYGDLPNRQYGEDGYEQLDHGAEW